MERLFIISQMEKFRSFALFESIFMWRSDVIKRVMNPQIKRRKKLYHYISRKSFIRNHTVWWILRSREERNYRYDIIWWKKVSRRLIALKKSTRHITALLESQEGQSLIHILPDEGSEWSSEKRHINNLEKEWLVFVICIMKALPLT